jgi:predicted molibdopterin-dependent oxidoreductase YjgC
MKLTIDHQTIEIQEPGVMTVLDAAEKQGIYIPHLCSHPQLTPYGGCRLCIVEIDGMKGFPTACTTNVKEGLNVKTKTDMLQAMRKEIMQLILSEHPSGCLICEEEDECSKTQETIRKVGTTTGCRWCPKDGDCELQRLVRYLELEEIEFPIYYHDLEVEKYDPFYDRDYNLCIYCGRCLRICSEQRRSFVLGLNQRGKKSTVGPAFHQTHVDAGCEFCGACVSVCPTGALSEKNRKWSGVPDSYTETICPLCGMVCKIQAAVAKGKIVGTLPPGDPHHSGGELCVKGRFCLSETVNHPDRLQEPMYRFPETMGIVSWDTAIEKAAEHLKRVIGKRTAFYLSPNLPMEEIAAVRQFAHRVLDSSNITTSVLDENMAHYLGLTEKSVPLEKLEEADLIVSLFLRGNYRYAPLSLAMKRAAESGTPLYQVGWTTDTVSRYAARNIVPPQGKEKLFFRKFSQAMERGKGGPSEIKELVKMLEEAAYPVIVVGPEIVDLSDCRDILNSIEKIIQSSHAGLIGPLPYSNLTGLLAVTPTRLSEDIDRMVREEKIDLLYIIGDNPFSERPPVDFIVYQGTFSPPDELVADLILPSAGWGEVSGTYAGTMERRTFKSAEAIVKPPGYAKENREILRLISVALGNRQAEGGQMFSMENLKHHIPGNFSIKLPEIKPLAKKRNNHAVVPPDPSYPWLLVRERTPHAYHMAGIGEIVEGMKMLVPEETVLMNAADAARLGLTDGDRVYVESRSHAVAYPLKIKNIIANGIVYLLSFAGPPAFDTNPCPVHLRREHV